MGGSRGRRVNEQDKVSAVTLIDEANQNGCRLKVACFDLEVCFKTFKSWKINSKDFRKGPRKAPKNKLTFQEKELIIKTSTSEEFLDYSPWIIVAKLADQGKYIASESSFYKVLKENKMLNHRGKSKAANSYRPRGHVASGVNEVWSWDITYLKSPIRGQFYYLYLMMDIWSRKIVGFDIHEEESMEHSANLMCRTCKIEGVFENQLVLHSDNGGPMKGATMLATLEKLCVAASFSRPRVSNDNPYSESLFKTLKYCPKYPDKFENLHEAKKWVINFIDWYNNHPHSGIKFVSPIERHSGLDIEILENRKKVYLKAKEKNPLRWNGKKIRNWDHNKKVYLNCLQENKNIGIKSAS